MGTIPDSMDGIFTMLKEAALTMQQGGGIGYDFSTLRPKGVEVRGVAADASGPLTFMDVWDAMCRTVMSAGSRRGAMMATMRCDHPDIEAFIEAKRDPARLRMFNLSVLVTDDFMVAVEKDQPWRLHFENRRGETLAEKIIPARALWDKIMESTYAYAEPGVIFIDRVNRDHNLGYLETIATTNPCGEKPMGPYASCLLGSVNLAKLVKDAFTPRAAIDIERLRRVIRTAIRMMDNVIDVGGFPLPQQRQKAIDDRQLGLGVTGLADALIMCGLTYGSTEAVRWTETVMREIALQSYAASVMLAKEKGSFPTFKADEFLHPERFAGRMLPAKLKDSIRQFGIRNGLLLSIAPTGTISLLAGNVSSGIEPVFALAYERKVLQPDGSRIIQTVEDFAVAAYRQFWLSGVDLESGNPNEPEEWSNSLLPGQFVTAQTLPPEAHVVMQAAAQKWVDSSISKTVNCPEDISFEDFKEVYALAYRLGCKGCTTYRPNDVTGSVLSVTPEKPAAVEPTPAPVEAPKPRPDALPGSTYKLKWPDSEHAIYVTVNDVVEDGQRRPFEVFINSKNMEHFAWTVALTRMISAVFRRPHDSRFVVEELKAVFDPKGGAWVGGRYVPSMLAAIGGVIETHMRAIGYITEAPDRLKQIQSEVMAIRDRKAAPKTCPSCSSSNTKHENGCFQCLDCGWSKCS
jgi:ribonucleoside-diphosphate reductase alpha chain